MSYLFVGEDRSQRAKDLKVTWKDGALAAKPLFEALRACDINPDTVEFVNWFEGGKKTVRETKLLVVALGKKVQAALVEEGIPHIAMIHPAARGRIRKRERYIAHVKEVLLGDDSPAGRNQVVIEFAKKRRAEEAEKRQAKT